MEITSNTDNALLRRQEMVFESDRNVSFNEAKKLVSEKTGKPESNIDVYTIRGKFGRNLFEIHANIYENPESLASIKYLEMSKKKRKELEETKKKAEEEIKSASEKSNVAVEENNEENSE